MKRSVFGLLASLFFANFAQAQEPSNLLTIVSSPEPQTQLMSMVLSMQSLQQGAKVDILLCGPAGDLALTAPPATATQPQQPKGMSPHGLMKILMEKGATVSVCALYLPNKPATTEALLTGIAVAKPDAMARRILAPNTKILSF
ncbi:MAG: hypothetical protein CL558_06065 [Alphaproteobacteria bacterium]|jgi:predicted peroxiredoxin|nr:hypothetical protein [Alphaproteobacteria bacterium]MAS48146.1 hypothetical protein [Alphaproteobacteria bacterium]MAX96836.1 hypothetical protein [Alphaproteobacteria bacterium]MBN53125.1 hypothetical protein [Alphaproteobacteria bacterium]OUT39964.1 MAG: hypothetical protein CBB62_11640 [Micavibrio sp. TMED2]|tara:strand:+ start:7942 stop:8373 length:432 start_codon:yes stop_codon:yes gene_type:complete